MAIDIANVLVSSIRPLSFNPAILLFNSDQWKIRIILTGPAPAGGILVNIGCSNPAAVPLPRTFPPGSAYQINIDAGKTKSADFVMPKVVNKSFVSPAFATIGAFAGGVFKHAQIIVSNQF